jgi:hypothetical protein
LRIARSTRLVVTGYLRANSVCVAQATKILRPRPVGDDADDHMSDVPGANFLYCRRSGKKGIDLTLDTGPSVAVIDP